MRVKRAARRVGYPDRIIETWDEVVLGRDEYGEWAGIPAGSLVSIFNGDICRLLFDRVHCYPADKWWVAVFNAADERVVEVSYPDGRIGLPVVDEELYVHMAEPASIDETGLAFVDLVLDVIRMPDGKVTVLDEDEVEEIATTWMIPDEFIANARAACDDVAKAMRARTEPFGEVGLRWLDRLKAGTLDG